MTNDELRIVEFVIRHSSFVIQFSRLMPNRNVLPIAFECKGQYVEVRHRDACATGEGTGRPPRAQSPVHAGHGSGLHSGMPEFRTGVFRSSPPAPAIPGHTSAIRNPSLVSHIISSRRLASGCGSHLQSGCIGTGMLRARLSHAAGAAVQDRSAPHAQ